MILNREKRNLLIYFGFASVSLCLRGGLGGAKAITKFLLLQASVVVEKQRRVSVHHLVFLDISLSFMVM